MIIDYLCNAFTPDRAAAWDAAIAGQGIPLKVRRDPDDSFCDPATMVARMDELGIVTLVLVAGDEAVHAGQVQHSTVSARYAEVEELHRRWMASGLITQLPDPAQDVNDDDPEDQPVVIKGEPLSETILRERR